MQQVRIITTTAGRVEISRSSEMVVFNDREVTAAEARAIADALNATAAAAEYDASRRAANYKRATEAHAMQLLASVQ